MSLTQTQIKAIRQIWEVQTTGKASGRYLPSIETSESLVKIGFLADKYDFKLTELGTAWVKNHPKKG